MRNILFNIFKVLMKNAGEDIFEYGWESFEEKKYLRDLYDRHIITKELWIELDNDDAELFQIIQAVDEEDYDNGLKTFVNYICNTFDEEQISALMWNFEN